VDDAALAQCAAEPRTAPELTGTPRRLTTFFDFKSPQSYLALPAILALKSEGIAIDWRPFVSKPLKVPAPESADEDRSTKHRRIRGEYHADNIQRYAPHPLTDIYRETDCRFADMGLLWLQDELQPGRDVVDNVDAVNVVDAVDDYVQRVFVHLWRDAGAIDSAQAIEPLLLAVDGLQAGFDRTGQGAALVEGWRKYARGRGLEHLDAARAAAQSRSPGMAPTFFLGSEPFQGHAQLPLIAARLKAGI
jgi:2-hydroxychromene-2-carboxylate isomerase